jgi:Domain of unknown function (DUF4388)
MALQGTLKDFGIADILQLIGQQQKTGTLHLHSREQEVHVGFREGVIVGAESATRRRKDRIGAMLVRAELITEAQLQEALELQRRSLRRLGDVLVGMGALDAGRFRKIVQLQVNETLYGLFSWKSGTYAFEAGDVEEDPEGITPVRPETVLMEGFRRVDEWPLIRKTIGSDALTFVRRRELPPSPAASAGDLRRDDGLDAALAQAPDGLEQSGELMSLGPAERAVFGRVEPGRTVRNLVDVCLLGEFDTCKALHNLVSLGYLEVAPLQGRATAAQRTATLRRLAGTAGRVLLAVGVLGAAGALAVRASEEPRALVRERATALEDAALQRHLSRAQQARIRAALDVYRLERGEFPTTLAALVQAGLLTEGDLHFPWAEPYYYRRTSPREFVLLPPLR